MFDDLYAWRSRRIGENKEKLRLYFNKKVSQDCWQFFKQDMVYPGALKRPSDYNKSLTILKNEE